MIPILVFTQEIRSSRDRIYSASHVLILYNRDVRNETLTLCVDAPTPRDSKSTLT